MGFNSGFKGLMSEFHNRLLTNSNYKQYQRGKEIAIRLFASRNLEKKKNTHFTSENTLSHVLRKGSNCRVIGSARTRMVSKTSLGKRDPLPTLVEK